LSGAWNCGAALDSLLAEDSNALVLGSYCPY
jgi:hypothetical protein